MVLALQPGARGVYNVAGPGEVPLSAILGELGRAPIPVPASLLRPAVARLFAAGLVSFPPEEVDHIQYLCVVDGTRAERELGWAPRRGLRETIRSVL
jgi:UDP-glucose 4-epimerase